MATAAAVEAAAPIKEASEDSEEVLDQAIADIEADLVRLRNARDEVGVPPPRAPLRARACCAAAKRAYYATRVFADLPCYPAAACSAPQVKAAQKVRLDEYQWARTWWVLGAGGGCS